MDSSSCMAVVCSPVGVLCFASCWHALLLRGVAAWSCWPGCDSCGGFSPPPPPTPPPPPPPLTGVVALPMKPSALASCWPLGGALGPVQQLCRPRAGGWRGVAGRVGPHSPRWGLGEGRHALGTAAAGCQSTGRHTCWSNPPIHGVFHAWSQGQDTWQRWRIVRMQERKINGHTACTMVRHARRCSRLSGLRQAQGVTSPASWAAAAGWCPPQASLGRGEVRR